MLGLWIGWMGERLFAISCGAEKNAELYCVIHIGHLFWWDLWTFVYFTSIRRGLCVFCTLIKYFLGSLFILLVEA